MEKKPYVQPETKVVEVDDVEIICTSQFPSTQNESWDELDESITSDWF